ncbi:MAG: hypothetical protein ACYCRD_02705 [Leptospirillum sp.]
MTEPLRKRRPDGSLYRRRQEVEEELGRLEMLDLAEILYLARQGESRRGDSVSSEALVHVLRREIRSVTAKSPVLELDGLLSILTIRCEGNLRQHLGGFDEIDRDEISKQVIDQVVDVLCDGGDIADYAEVNFNDWLKYKRIDACRKQEKTGWGERVDINAIDDLKSPDPTPEYEYIMSEAREKASLPSLLEDADLMPEVRYAIAAAIKNANLPDNILQAYLMHHYLGVQIESKNEGKHTLVKHFGKSEKTIRLWLVRAEEAFSKLRGTTNEHKRNETSKLGIGTARLSH